MVSIQSCNGGTGLSFFGEDEIFCDILSRLPIKSLMRFKSVCTDWQLLIEKDSNFINLQLTRSKSDVNRTSLLVFPLHKPGCVGAETRILLFPGDEEEEKDENRSSSGEVVVPCDLMLSCRNIIDTDFSIPIGVEMLKPVNGLVCFVNHLSGSILIYNPSTRQRTSWIKTNVEIEKEEYLRESKVAVRGDTYETNDWSPYYGFGFDPMTKEHKVVCVNKLAICTRSVFSFGVKFGFICEVLTVGENIWRKLDEAPGWFRGGTSVYVNGYIYWMGSQSYFQSDDIMGFSVGSEKFDRVITIPNFMLDLWCYKNNKRVSTLVVFELVAVDGHLTIIDREGDRWINLWIYNENDGNGEYCNWTKQEMPMPYVCDGTGCLALEHIAGTDIIMVKGTPNPKPLGLEYCFYYNRKKKEHCRKQVEFIRSTKPSFSPYCSRCPDLGYKVTSFFQTILPVQTKT